MHDHEDEEDSPIKEETTDESATMQAVKVGDTVELSLNSVVGFTTPGMIGDQEVISLIDRRATHNFIAQRIVNALELPVIETAQYEVIMGSGAAVKGKGVCKAMTLNVAEVTIIENFLP